MIITVNYEVSKNIDSNKEYLFKKCDFDMFAEFFYCFCFFVFNIMK